MGSACATLDGAATTARKPCPVKAAARNTACARTASASATRDGQARHVTSSSLGRLAARATAYARSQSATAVRGGAAPTAPRPPPPLRWRGSALARRRLCSWCWRAWARAWDGACAMRSSYASGARCAKSCRRRRSAPSPRAWAEPERRLPSQAWRVCSQRRQILGSGHCHESVRAPLNRERM